jgi:hypothetical protein
MVVRLRPVTCEQNNQPWPIARRVSPQTSGGGFIEQSHYPVDRAVLLGNRALGVQLAIVTPTLMDCPFLIRHDHSPLVDEFSGEHLVRENDQLFFTVP